MTETARRLQGDRKDRPYKDPPYPFQYPSRRTPYQGYYSKHVAHADLHFARIAQARLYGTVKIEQQPRSWTGRGSYPC